MSSSDTGKKNLDYLLTIIISYFKTVLKFVLLRVKKDDQRPVYLTEWKTVGEFEHECV